MWNRSKTDVAAERQIVATHFIQLHPTQPIHSLLFIFSPWEKKKTLIKYSHFSPLHVSVRVICQTLFIQSYASQTERNPNTTLRQKKRGD